MSNCKECYHNNICEMWKAMINIDESVCDGGCVEFKDKSLIIELKPLQCKVGDKFYTINSEGNISLHSIEVIKIDGCNTKYYDIFNQYFEISDIGKSVFFTKKEAEAALQNLKK